MSISNIIDSDGVLLVSQVDAESANISGLINCVDLIAVNDVTANKVFIADGEIKSEIDNSIQVGLDNNYFALASVNGKAVFSRVGKMASCSLQIEADTLNIGIANKQLTLSFQIPTDFQPVTNFGDEVIGTIRISNQMIFFPATPVLPVIYADGVTAGSRLSNDAIICSWEYTQGANTTLYIGINASWSLE